MKPNPNHALGDRSLQETNTFSVSVKLHLPQKGVITVQPIGALMHGTPVTFERFDRGLSQKACDESHLTAAEPEMCSMLLTELHAPHGSF